MKPNEVLPMERIVALETEQGHTKLILSDHEIRIRQNTQTLAYIGGAVGVIGTLLAIAGLVVSLLKH